MSAIAVDLSNPVEIRTAGKRVLVDALGTDGAQVFLNNYVQEYAKRPKITAEQISAILTKAMEEAVTGIGKGSGNFTEERHEQPDPPHKELLAAFERQEAEINAIMSEHPKYTLKERLREQTRRETKRREIR